MHCVRPAALGFTRPGPSKGPRGPRINPSAWLDCSFPRTTKEYFELHYKKCYIGAERLNADVIFGNFGCSFGAVIADWGLSGPRQLSAPRGSKH